MNTALFSPRLKKYSGFFIAVFFTVIVIDQLSKYLVISKKLFRIYYNDTIAFSLPIPWYAPWIIIAVVIGSAAYTQRGKLLSGDEIDAFLSQSSLRAALPLIAGGGISNIIDRVFHNGAVVDFIDLHYWPVFNLADSAIVIGVVLIIYHVYQKRGA